MSVSPTIFRTAGLLVGETPGNVPVDAATMKFWGYSYVGILGVGGDKIYGDPDTFTQADWDAGKRKYPDYQDYLHQAGLKSIPWHKMFGGDQAAVQAQARAAASFIARFHPDGFIVNPETEYKQQEGSWRNKVYVDALLAELARLGVDPKTLVWAVAPLGSAVPGNHFDWDIAQYQRLPGCFCLPEAYWAPQNNVDGGGAEYRPLLCADEWIGAHGWPADRFGLLLGWWNGNFPAADQYLADLALVKQKYPKWGGGFGVYLADQMTSEVIAEFGQGVAKGFAAASETQPAPAPVPAPQPAPAPVAAPPNPADVRTAIADLCDTWLTKVTGTQRLSRLRLIRRIAATEDTDPRWTAARDAVAAALDKAGVP